MWYNKKILCIPIWAVGIAVLAAAAGYAQQQAMQLTTYYPAPYGEYNEMKAAEKLTVLENGELSVGNIFKVNLDRNLGKNPYPVQATALFDLNDPDYKMDPNSDDTDPAKANRLYRLDVFHDTAAPLQPGETPSSITLGGMEFRGWPVITGSRDYVQIPTAPTIQVNDNSMKVYYGSVTNNSKSSVKVDLPTSTSFTNTDYFIMILPQQFHATGFLHIHNHKIKILDFRWRVKIPGLGWKSITISLGSTHSGYNSSPTYFTYYKWSPTERKQGSFTVNFEAAVPQDFEWIAIGY